MTIKQIDSKKVLISLCEQDIKDFSMPFEKMNFNDEHSKTVLSEILSLACDKASFCLNKDKSLLVEAIPYNNGCLLLVTLLDSEKKRKSYRIKKTVGFPCYCFLSVDGFLGAVESLFDQVEAVPANSAYMYNDRYYIVFHRSALSARVKLILSEFTGKYSNNRALVSRVEENGKLLSDGNAVVLISTAMKGKNI